MTHTPVCRSDCFVYSGRIKQPFFPFHINKKRPALGWSILCSKKPDCPSVPVPKQGTRSSRSTSSSSSAAAGRGIFGRKVEQCCRRLVFILRQGQLLLRFTRQWQAEVKYRQTDSSVRGGAIKQPVRLTSKDSPADKLHLKVVWPPTRPRLVHQTCKQMAVRGWWADESRQGWSAGEFPQIVSLGKKHEDAAVSTWDSLQTRHPSKWNYMEFSISIIRMHCKRTQF